MAEQPATGYLPGDPRYGLQGEALKDYYRTKAAQWAIYWDKAPNHGGHPARAAAGAEGLPQKLRRARHRLRPFRVRRRPRHAGHVVLYAARRPRGGGRIRHGQPMNKAGATSKVEIHRWSNSFGKRAADYRRKGMQQFLCTGPKTGTNEYFRQHLHARVVLRVVWRQPFSADRSARRTRGQYRHSAAAGAAGPRGGGQVLERGAVFEERGVSKDRS